MFKTKICALEVYHGSKVVSNDFYIEHFKKRGKDVEHFLRDVIGRDKRYLIDSDDENTLTMSITATKKALDKSGLSGSDLDMIVFSSQLSEYISPPSSIHLHNAIDGKSECVCLDMNTNCSGMSIAFEQACKYMSVSENINRVLIVGCDYINLTVDPENEYCYGHYGDAACALIIEKATEDCGLIDSAYSVNSAEHNNILFPPRGFSKLFKLDDIHEEKLTFLPFECDWLQTGAANIKKILKNNNIGISDVKMFCLSQYIYRNIEILRTLLEIDETKSIYVGGEYGYTGTSSPFIALYESINRKLVQKGDYIVIWTIGAGTENIAVLLKL